MTTKTETKPPKPSRDAKGHATRAPELPGMPKKPKSQLALETLLMEQAKFDVIQDRRNNRRDDLVAQMKKDSLTKIIADDESGVKYSFTIAQKETGTLKRAENDTTLISSKE